VKTLVFASDILPLPGLPTSGGGLRSWQLIKGLESQGIETSFSMPGEDRFLEREYRDNIDSGVRETSWRYDNQDEIVRHFSPDAIIFANPDLNNLREDHQIPIVSDLHGPRLIEFELLFNDDSPQKRGSNLRRKLTSLLKTDFFTCAGRFQRYYFLGYLLMAGFSLEDINIAYMPVSLSPDLPQPDKDLDDKRFIFSGGFYPWQNPVQSLYVLSEVLGQEGQASLHIFGGSHHISEDDTNKFDQLKNSLEQNPSIKFLGYLSHQDVLEEYRTGYVAFELMERNFEREMAFTTRTIEFLWAGLPVIYNDYSDLSSYIKEYRAGWCVNPHDDSALRNAIRQAIHEPELVLEYGRNAQRLVRDCFTWDKTIQPLVDYLANPSLSDLAPELSSTPLAYALGLENQATLPDWESLQAENLRLKNELDRILSSKTWRWSQSLFKGLGLFKS
jgi:glycosyltransferase involved in cell wall biosynthesis